jgi:hypothetical protein
METIDAVLGRVGLFRECLEEQREALVDFWATAGRVLEGSGVALQPLPRSWTALRHNHFSVLFVAVLRLHGIPAPRRRLYTRITHCLRCWVTACDNLLDDELRETLLTDLPAGAGVFKSAHTLLVVDRVFFLMLRDAERAGVITAEESGKLVAVSLAALTASGRQEAEEEHGVAGRLRPAAVLREVHGRKAGMLFTAPLAAPAALGDLARGRRQADLARGLHRFGLGVQILDDLNDLGQDLAGHRQSYFASTIAHGADAGERRRLEALEGDAAARDDAGLWRQFPKGLARTQAACLAQFRVAVELLCRGGLPLGRAERAAFVAGLAAVVKHPPLAARLRAR